MLTYTGRGWNNSSPTLERYQVCNARRYQQRYEWCLNLIEVKGIQTITDIFIPRHAGGKDAALDVTVVNPLQAALVAQAAETPSHALKVAHKRKLDKSWQACNQQGIVFLPLAVESLGAWHKSAISEIKKLGSALSRHTGEEEITTTRHLFQQLSIALVKGNTALLNNRNPRVMVLRGMGVWGGEEQKSQSVPALKELLCELSMLSIVLKSKLQF